MVRIGKKRMGWLGWTVTVLLMVVTGLYGTYRYALARNAVAVLDWADSRFRSGDEARLATAAQFGSDPAQKVRVYLPLNAKAASPGAGLPIVLFIHGGSWASGDPDDYGFVARALAPHGYAVVLAGYRLYPHAEFPAMVEDGAAALKWTSDHAAEFGGDPQRIVLMGHSAGAYNVMMVALDQQRLASVGLTQRDIRGVVGLAGPYDFLPFTSDATRNSFGREPDPAATQPLRFVTAEAPPLLLLTGDEDTTVKPRNSLALARAMTGVGVPTRAEVMPGINHEGILMKLAEPFAARDRRVMDAVLPFLARVNAPAVPAAAPIPAPPSAAVQAAGVKPRA